MAQQITDEIIAQLRTGSKQAFTLVFKQYWKKLYAIAYRRVEDEAAAEDIVQEIFIALWDKHSQFTINSANIEFYLLKAVKSRVINYYVSQKVKRDMLAMALMRMEQFSDLEQVGAGARYQELEALIDKEIDTLPPTMKAIFLMKSNNHSIASISSTLNLAEQTVKNNLTKASHRLRKSLLQKFSDEKLATIIVTAFFFTKS
ncbi:RNA polymerase sigma-70 factor [Olivibacter ginsenosidimutans]|uniref:RNA polymerase sigma-70 factor n=1 Tax=Olivibacter ginsenosidimutans TaxID=1176537 RepID=A0ABP9AEC4_9SPHI